MEEEQNFHAGQGRCVRGWLQPYPWEDVVRTLATFWHMPEGQFEEPAARQVRQLWEREAQREMTLADALRLCRQCQTGRPFGKYDCESFVIIARDVLKPILGQISATLATAVITIVGDYVRGAGDEVEMQQALHLILEKFAEYDGPSQSASPGGL